MTDTCMRKLNLHGAMRAVAPLLVLLVIGSGILASACGGSPAPAATDPESPATTAATAATDPETLAQAVVRAWSESMQALVALLADKPEVSAVLPQVRDLKERAVQSLVSLGRQRESLSDSDRARADSLEWSAMQALAGQTWYAAYNDLWSYYSSLDMAFANLVAAFNTLTQYSDFALLRQQLPGEAARLGVK